MHDASSIPPHGGIGAGSVSHSCPTTVDHRSSKAVSSTDTSHCGSIPDANPNPQLAWAPWSDKSYLTEEDLQDPDISANVRAIDDTFELISFVAATEDGEYVGYWRGVDDTPVANAPVVLYSNDGQFSLCGNRMIEAPFFISFGDDLLDELRSRANTHGFRLDFESIDDLPESQTTMKPDAYHMQQYVQYED